MTDIDWWLGALTGFCAGVGLVGTLLFLDAWGRRP